MRYDIDGYEYKISNRINNPKKNKFRYKITTLI